MAASGAPERQPRRGPAPIASFDHDVSDESSPETKQAFRLPEIREDRSCGVGGDSLAPPEQRARSHSTPAAGALAPLGALHTPAAPRIDISRASSSSHQDSRDSSPELALFAGGGGEESRARLELGFREDGALDLRSSTEELAFLEGAPGEPRPAPPPAAERRHSRKDSQGSEAALLAVSGRTSRLSSVGSQCSAHSALSGLSRTSRLSVVSGVSRSPSPHRMLLETSFCGPRPIENDPEICAAAVEERLLEIAKLTAPPPPPIPVTVTVDARDRREVRTEATVESGSARVTAPVVPGPSTIVSATVVAPPPPAVKPTTPVSPPTATAEPEKVRKETDNRARVEERRARPKLRREPSEPEVYKSGNRTKNVIRIKLKPDEDYGEEEEEVKRPAPVEVERAPPVREPVPSEPEPGARASRPTELVGRAPTSPAQQRRRVPRESRTPSPAGVPVSRKSSFCSLFKSRETIASPDSPSEALRRKRSLTEGRSRSKSRDRSATPTSTTKIRGSVLSLFRTPRKSATSPSPSSREGSPVVPPQRSLAPSVPPERTRPGEKLKYYEDTRDGIIHIPLHTPPDERPASASAHREPNGERASVSGATPTPAITAEARDQPRPASAPATRVATEPVNIRTAPKPIQRTVLPDGSIIIPLRSPTERVADIEFPQSTTCERSPEPTVSRLEPAPESTPPAEGRDEADGAEASPIRERVMQNTTEVSRELVEAPPSGEDDRKRRKERMTFTTHVGSREQVFSTQFSITKTPSVTSEISGTFPAFGDGEETPTSARDVGSGEVGEIAAPGGATDATDPPRDSSESEPSSEAAAPRDGSEVERRGLVVQESFEEELPYVPTTLPLERPVALPMVPVRERGGVHVSAVERPRAAPPPAPRPRAPAPPPASAPAADKLRIRLPRRPRPASTAPAARPSRPRTRSGGDGAESRPKEWIDFEEVPERRKQPKRIQTLPGGAAGVAAGAAPGGGVVFSYVEPEHCRCECHAHTRPMAHTSAESPPEDTRPGTSFPGELEAADHPAHTLHHAFN
ncbi:serine/arginine repetitive matrix protein 1 [Manduca sexta]|uniref:Uncharacterized protein n=1 Tax=Manduca sexta TaxID=7130 RepID=A0A921ZA85_MANSE|nr:serine/arginine repetitive matrix protein 1 [Manduca sexta]KAG6454273.1 hypothetical protein O3G_MSEX008608 [Manduca sexta]